MDQKKWIAKIKALMRKAGTWEAHYQPIVETLADVLAQRDEIYERYRADGSEPVVIHTNKFGAENATKNPLLTLWMDLNTQALTYWRDLGLTPAALKKITGEVKKEEKGSALIRALESAGSA
jgi:phage terminase small subunit